MDHPPKPRKVYQSHRENQRERILAAAEELFIQNGINGVTLGDIADSARLSRVTLYEYFPDKEEIAWAIFQKVVAEMRDDSRDECFQATGSGYQKLEEFTFYLLRRLETHPEQLRFIAVFNFLYGHAGSAARMRGALEQNWPGYYALPVEWIREGIQDGSVRVDVAAELTAAALFNLAAGMSSRFALLGNVVQDEYGFSVMELYQAICRSFLRGIRSG
jgi:AcrR family transcriptional regulator